MKKIKLNKKLTLSSILILAVFILSACSLGGDIEENNENNNPVDEVNQGENQAEVLVGHDWTWIKTTKGEEVITPTKKNAFVINFNEDMSVSGTTDCNGFFGDYMTEEDEIEFGPLASTMMYCENSQENQFTADLDMVESFYIGEDGNLFLNLEDSEGVIEFQEKLVINQPEEGKQVSSPLEIKGEAIGTWFFEGSFVVILTDWDGKIIAEAPAQMTDTEETWMTEDLVSFTTTLEFENPVFEDAGVDHFSRRGILIFEKANPSGLLENTESIEKTISFK
ncbi:MAG: META domain-containing protein [Patescibacteria group bacterium]|jgi:heat shock protein HslJ|nr:META domain-containing protein [Patescibacteria group bacterium]